MSETRAAYSAVERAARDAYGRLVAVLATQSRDLAGTEDALGDALTAALEQWPRNGVPDRPEAWLLTVARRRRVDAVRRASMARGHEPALEILEQGRLLDRLPTDGDQVDRRLALLFVCTHPAIDQAMHAPLMLQTALGLTAAQIAPLFLISPTTLGQQLVRIKKKIQTAGIPFDIPEKEKLAARLPSVLDGIYAAFSAGQSARDLVMMEEAIHLADLCAVSLPDVAEAKGLLALMLFTRARHGADRGEAGQFVPLSSQDPSLWEGGMIEKADQLLVQAAKARRPDRYQLEAAIQSAHCHRVRTGQDTRLAVVGLYRQLIAVAPSIGARTGFAAALLAADQPAEAKRELSALPAAAENYQPYWAVQAAVRAALGDIDTARTAYEKAILLAGDEGVRRHLTDQKTLLSGQIDSHGNE